MAFRLLPHLDTPKRTEKYSYLLQEAQGAEHPVAVTYDGKLDRRYLISPGRIPAKI